MTVNKPHHAAAALLVLAKGEGQVAEGLCAGLHWHGLIVLEPVVLHPGPDSAGLTGTDTERAGSAPAAGVMAAQLGWQSDQCTLLPLL